MAAAGGNNCAAGASAGVIGESVGELLYNNGNGLSKEVEEQFYLLMPVILFITIKFSKSKNLPFLARFFPDLSYSQNTKTSIQ